jgi:hypothetical protein
MKQIKIVLLFVFVSHSLQAQELTAFMENKLYGYKNEKNEIVIQPKFDWANRFSEGLAVVEMARMENGKKVYNQKTYELEKDWYVINTKGTVLFKLNYPYRKLFYIGSGKYVNNRLPVSDGYKWGYIDGSGKEVIKPQFEIANDFSEMLSVVKTAAGYLVIDTMGKMIVPAGKYEKIEDFKNGTAIIRNGIKYGCIGKKGEEIIKPMYDYFFGFKNGLNTPAMFQLNKKYGLVDAKGKHIAENIYDNIFSFKDEWFVVQQGNLFGAITHTGKISIPLEYEMLGGFNIGLSMAKKNGKMGFINKENKAVIPLMYEKVNGFGDSYLAAVQFNGKWGFIDNKNKTVIPFKYQDAYWFSEGLVAVKLWDLWGFINEKGEEVIGFYHDRVYNFSNGVVKVYINGKEYILDKKGDGVKQ